jgi:predicted permease
VLLAGLDFSAARPPLAERIAFFRRLREQLAATPGVRSVSVSQDVPLSLDGHSWEGIDVPGYAPKPGENMKLWRNLISPGYFETLHIPLTDGRDFSYLDNTAAPPVAIVNQTFAHRFFTGTRAVGRKLRMWDKDIAIVGVVQDSKYLELNEAPMPYFYLPLTQFYRPGAGAAVETRVSSNPIDFEAILRKRIHSVDPRVMVIATVPFTHYLSGAYFAQKIGAALLTVLGAVSLILAILGLYGVMAYSIAQRTSEIGIRMALGAQPDRVLRLVMRDGLLLCAAGLAGGLLPSILFSRIAAGALYGTPQKEGWIYLAAALILTICALFASWIPARHAALTDPVTALRWE